MKREHEFTGDVVEQESDGSTWLEVWNERPAVLHPNRAA
jgi:hypothetical protein